MRLAVALTINIVISDDNDFVRRTDTRAAFWRVLRLQSTRSFPEIGDDEAFARRQEQRLGSRFPSRLESYLRQHSGRSEYTKSDSVNLVTVIVREISYGSLNIGLDVITASLASIGLTADDYIDLISRYTPDALSETVEIGSADDFKVKATGTVTQADPTPPTPAPQNSLTPQPVESDKKSRLERIWWIANFSLVLPAFIMLVGSFLIFQRSGEENAQTRAYLSQERDAVASERKQLLDKDSDRLKLFDEYITQQLKHFSDLNEVEGKIMQEKLKSIQTLTSEPGRKF